MTVESGFGDVIPADVIAHEHGESCVCGPAPVPVVAGDGRRGVITAHQPLVGDIVAPDREHSRSD